MSNLDGEDDLFHGDVGDAVTPVVGQDGVGAQGPQARFQRLLVP